MKMAKTMEQLMELIDKMPDEKAKPGSDGQGRMDLFRWLIHRGY